MSDYLKMADIAFDAIFKPKERRKEVQVFTEERRKENLSDQMDDLCGVCLAASGCTCDNEVEP